MNNTRKIFFFKNHEENEAAPDLFPLFKKALYEVKVSGLQLTFNMF